MPSSGQTNSVDQPAVAPLRNRPCPNLRGGALTALGLFATDIGYGYIAYAPLGHDFASTGIIAAFMASILGSMVPALVGGSGPMFGGPRPAQTLIFAALLLSLIGTGGAGDPVRIIVVGAACVSLAGAMQMAFGYLGVARMIRFTPLPVLAGFTNGVALSMMLSAGLIIIGSHAGVSHGEVDSASLLLRLAVVAGVLFLMARIYRVLPALHWSLVGLIVGVLVHASLFHLAPGLSLGAMLPGVASLQPASGLAAIGFDLSSVLAWHQDWTLILAPALSLAVLNSLETLILASQQDMAHGSRHDGKRVLIGQGLGNLVCGLLGGLPSAPSNSRQLVAIQTGATRPSASLAFGFTMLGVMCLTPLFAHAIPQLAVATILVFMAYQVIDPWARNQVRAWLGREGSPAFRKQLRSNLTIMLVVMTVAVAVNLVAALAAGVVLSMLQFVRHNSRSNVARVFPGDKRHSAVMRPLAHVELLRSHGRRIALVELSGPLFFGSGELLLDEVEQLAGEAGQIILDFRQVSTIDASGAGVIHRIARSLRRRRVHLRLSSISPVETRGRLIVQSGHANLLPPECWYPDSDLALEAAEDAVLIAVSATDGITPVRMLDLEGFRGLDEAEVAVLLGFMHEHVYAKGDYLFRRKDQGDTLFILLSGRVEIRVQVAKEEAFKRLVALRPGVIFGEMAILRGTPRSADAVASDDATEVLSLQAEALQQLSLQHPRIALILMRNIGVQLAARLASVTDELRHALPASMVENEP